MEAYVGTLPDSRLKTLTIPREHGAWGMMLIPLITGAIVGSKGANWEPITLFLVAAVSLFWLRTPLESGMGTSTIKARSTRERRTALAVALAPGALAAIALVWLFLRGYARGLCVIGAVSAVAFVAQSAIGKIGRKGRMPAQFIGAIGLTSTAAGAYYVQTGCLNRIAIALWLANWLFAMNQVHFVQLRIHSSRVETTKEKLQQGYPFLAGQVALIGAVAGLTLLGFLPTLAMLAFIPVLLRGIVWLLRKRQPLNVHRLGFSELAQSTLFGALLCVAFLM